MARLAIDLGVVGFDRCLDSIAVYVDSIDRLFLMVDSQSVLLVDN
jgi:hypothetical protein